MSIGMSKEEAVKKVESLSKDKRNQVAIVNLITGKGKIEKIVHQIPGGATLSETESAETLPIAIKNWLRRTNKYERVEISFIGDYDSYEDLADETIKPSKKRLEDFNHKPGLTFFWERKGIQYMSEIIAKAFIEAENPISIIVEKEGLFLITDKNQKFDPSSDKWNPVIIFHKIRN